MSTSLSRITSRNNITSIIAQGGILTGITVLLATLGNLFSLVELFQYLAMSPIIIAGVLRGPIFGIQIALSSTLLICILWGFFPAGFFFFISIVPLAVVLGYLFRKEMNPKRIIVFTIIILSISMICLFWVSIKVSGIELDRDFQTFSRTFHIATSDLVEYFILLLPSLVFFAALCYAFYIWIFNSYLLDKLGLAKKKEHYYYIIFNLFRLPRHLIIILFIGIALYATSIFFKLPAIRFIGINLALITSVLFFFKGIFFLSIIFRNRMSKAINILLFLLAISIGIPVMIVSGLLFTLFEKENQFHLFKFL